MPGRASMAGSNPPRVRQLAQRRDPVDAAKVAESILRGRQRCPGREKRQLVEGALALPGQGLRPPRCLALGVRVEAARHLRSRCRQPLEQRRAAASVAAGVRCRRQILLKPRRAGRSGSSRGVHENPSVSLSPSNNRAPGSCGRAARAGPAARSADGRPGCRCRRSRYRAGGSGCSDCVSYQL